MAGVDLGRLHERVLQRDEKAISSLATHLLVRLPPLLQMSFRLAAVHDVHEAVDAAITDYTKNPSRFDASRGTPLDRYVYMAAWRNLANIVRDTTRQKAYEDAYAREAADASAATSSDSPHRRYENAERRRLLLSLVDSETERRALLEWLDGATVSELAVALGVSHLLSGQRREVKRFKDRILRRVHRCMLQVNGSARNQPTNQRTVGGTSAQHTLARPRSEGPRSRPLTASRSDFLSRSRLNEHRLPENVYVVHMSPNILNG